MALDSAHWWRAVARGLGAVEQKEAPMNPEVLSRHEAAFLDWLDEAHPALKDHILAQQGDGNMSGFLDTLSSTINNVITGASNAVGTYVKGKEQIDLVKINWERAKKGLPIFNTVAEAQAAMKSGPISTTGTFGGTSIFKSPYFWIAIGIGAYLLLRGRSRERA